MKNTFGMFIKQKRIEKNLSIRAFSIMIEISPEYLSKIENNLRSAPKDNVLEKIANLLDIKDEDREKFYDLAAESKPYLTLSIDLVKYIIENEMVFKTLRFAKRNNLSNKDWQDIYEYIKNSKII